MEHRRVRQIEVVATIDRTDRDQPHRRIVLLHVPDLHRGRVRAQQRERLRRVRSLSASRCAVERINRRRQRLREIQRVLHVARRVVGRHVERFEVVIVVLDLRAFEDLIAEAREDLLHLLAHQAERMAIAEHRRAAGQRDVDRARGSARRGERGFALAEAVARPSRFSSFACRPSSRFSSGVALPTRSMNAATQLPLRPTQRVAERVQIGGRTHARQLLAEEIEGATRTERGIDGDDMAGAVPGAGACDSVHGAAPARPLGFRRARPWLCRRAPQTPRARARRAPRGSCDRG